jgi:RNA methyltransferase, TrmH family
VSPAGPPHPDGPADPGALVELAGRADTVVLAGVHAVKHAVRFGAELLAVAAPDPDAARSLAEVVDPDLLPRLAAADRVTAELAARLTGGRPELVGIARRPRRAPAGDGPTVLLDNPRQLGNVGAVVRVAAGFGARAVLTTGTVDPWHPAVVRAGAGLHFALDVRRVDDVPGPVVAFDPEGEDLRAAAIPRDAVLAFGSERHGLSAAVRERAERLVAIPMRDQVSSYNLATSVAVALYAVTAPGVTSRGGGTPR